VEAAKAVAESSLTAVQSGLKLRVPALRLSVPTARPEDANKEPGQSSQRRVRIRSSSFGASIPAPPFPSHFVTRHSVAAHSDNDDNNRSSSPFSSVHDPSYPVPPHSETTILDERDDAAVENLLDSASAVPAPAAEGEGVAQSSVTAAEGSSTDKIPPQAEAAGGDEEDEDEELARFMQITLDGIARAQDGLRGVFALTRKRLVVKRAAAAARQVASVGGEAP
jgi:hypothetical protein